MKTSILCPVVFEKESAAQKTKQETQNVTLYDSPKTEMIFQFSQRDCERADKMASERKKRGGSTKTKYVHSAAKYSVDTRNTIGRLYAAWTGDKKKPRDFEDLLKKAGFCVTRQSLNNWRRAVEEGRDQ